MYINYILYIIYHIYYKYTFIYIYIYYCYYYWHIMYTYIYIYWTSHTIVMFAVRLIYVTYHNLLMDRNSIYKLIITVGINNLNYIVYKVWLIWYVHVYHMLLIHQVIKYRTILSFLDLHFFWKRNRN